MNILEVLIDGFVDLIVGMIDAVVSIF